MSNRQWVKRRTLARMEGPVRARASGQSLVEMALVLPILLLMLIGVFEVGWALRGYLVLSNADREATRFAARGRYLDFNQTTPETIGYPLVVSHTLDSLAAQLPADLSATSTNAGTIISHYVVDTGQPCTNMSTCNCSADDASLFDTRNAGNIADYDDQVHGPGPAWDNRDEWRFFSQAGLLSRIDDSTLRRELKDENNVFNCQLYKKDSAAAWSINSVVVVELFYNQPQLTGIFDTRSVLGRAIIPNPVPLYTQTKMRITADARTGGQTTGIGCLVWPIALHTSSLVGLNPGDMIGDVYNGSGSGNFGWLRWPPNTSAANEDYLVQELYNPNLSVSDFEDAKEAGDNVLNAGDWIWGNNGLSNSDDTRAAMDYLVGKDIRVPVWEDADGTGSGGSYKVAGFAIIRITDYRLPSTNVITAQFVRWDNDSCPGNGH